ncbi:MAG: MBL fold metallo-hydrolase [Sporocytophaga sp.]|uniref:MBL fold metallo-hydrolase n=1 Tax=Sporocytophaga sp. TaxID=2231183 RepID=UPI001B098261|nr:rhodanese-like domain-containing protein [Sporocytophaga sp.]MBO9703549.1 MBL fold metallo-hydrolase [Sporocytophaga sp.]
MQIESFFDKGLAQLSYAIISEGEIALIDPARDTSPFTQLESKYNAKIKAVIETHPHADFISSHGEFSLQEVKVYASKLSEVNYEHTTFDDGDEIKIGAIKLKAINTPGHSPDSISVLLEDETENPYAIFTGDTLFIGDVGRPDLRESFKDNTTLKEKLAGKLYHSLHDKILKLPDDIIIFPAHGPGSLCGKSMSDNLSDTLGNQRKENYALQSMSESEFIKLILENQPFIPKYFQYDVLINKLGAPKLSESIDHVKYIENIDEILTDALIVDTRSSDLFKTGHIQGAINIPNGGKFETWLGSIISPDETFYLIASDNGILQEVLLKTAKIGYESKIAGAIVMQKPSGTQSEKIDAKDLVDGEDKYTIIDVREVNEVASGKYFSNAINIPLNKLRDNIHSIPSGKPIAVHCAGGYRSAIGSSMLERTQIDKVYDISESIKSLEALPKVNSQKK